MDTVVKGRHCHPSEKFRDYAVGKVERLERFGVPIIRVDIELSREHAPRQAATCERVELTVLGRGPVVRAEASAADPLAAFDLVLDKVESRLRRAADRKRVHHTSRGPATVRHSREAEPGPGERAGGGTVLLDGTARAAGDAAAVGPAGGALGALSEDELDDGPGADADGPFVVREKTHEAPPMTVEQALERMELVGHDFFLFQDVAAGAPSVVYRRRAYDYGLLHLSVVDA